jgi:hypothetical protein
MAGREGKCVGVRERAEAVIGGWRVGCGQIH